MLLSYHPGLGDYVPDTTSTASAGELDNAYQAFRHAMLFGGCPYSEFTPAACNVAMDAWVRGQSQGLLRVNAASFHAAGQAATKPYTLYGSISPDARLGSPEVESMVAAAARALGLTVSAATAAQIVTVRDVLEAAGLDVSHVDEAGNPIQTAVPPAPAVTPPPASVATDHQVITDTAHPASWVDRLTQLPWWAWGVVAVGGIFLFSGGSDE